MKWVKHTSHVQSSANLAEHGFKLPLISYSALSKAFLVCAATEISCQSARFHCGRAAMKAMPLMSLCCVVEIVDVVTA